MRAHCFRGAWAVDWSRCSQGGLMTCHQTVAPSPPPPPSLQNRPAAAKRPPGCCGYHLHPLRASTRSGQTCMLECYYRAWHCLLPCLLSMRSQLGIFNCQPPPLLPERDPSIPRTHINSCCIAPTVASSSLIPPHLHCLSPFRWLGSELENSHSCTLSCLTSLKPLILCSIQLAPVKCGRS